jgi:hypothetical protein
MPFSIGVIRAGSVDVPVDTIRTLHTELAAVGLSVAGTEADAAPQFGAETSAQLQTFQGCRFSFDE